MKSLRQQRGTTTYEGTLTVKVGFGEKGVTGDGLEFNLHHA
jgi:hypothetical protein